MILVLRQFNDWVQHQAAAIQASASTILDFTAGSVVRAIVEANASVALWFQWLLVRVLAMTRAASSDGADLDTWMGDFALTRLPAAQAVGLVTFSRISAGTSALIVPGTEVRTGAGTAFTVIADPSNGAWDATQGGFFAPSGTASVSVPVGAVVAGAAGNVSAGTINTIASAVAAIDAVTNALAFTNGYDAETDAAFRSRFVDYINTRSRATVTAVRYAALSVRQGLFVAVVENSPVDGSFDVIVDDGTGSPPSGLLTSVYQAVDAVRPVCSTFQVIAPTRVKVDIAFTFSVRAGYVKANETDGIEAAISAYINALGLGDDLYRAKLYDVIFNASPAVANVSVLTLDGGTSDIVAGAADVIRAGTVTGS